MNLWLLVGQPIMLGYVLSQYQFVNGADARVIDYSADGWFSSLDKENNGTMAKGNSGFNYAYTHYSFGSSNITRRKRELAKVSRLKTQDLVFREILKSQDLKDADVNDKFRDVTGGSSGLSKEKVDPDLFNGSVPEQTQEDDLLQHKKKKSKKYKKIGRKDRSKGIKVKTSSGHRFKKVNNNNNNKKKTKAFVGKKFVKAMINPQNMSDSNESMRKEKPVDIIVHIKMNDYH